MMDFELLVKQLENQAQAIEALVRNVLGERARWKPTPDEWSILEVINHLWDEEGEDFRAHLDLILHHSNDPWPGIDPQGWITKRRYNERDLAQSLDGFVRAREESLAWLKSLSSPDWDAAYEMPWGEITAGDMMAAWVAHDLLHTRQLVELHWAYTVQRVEPYRVKYAGEW